MPSSRRTGDRRPRTRLSTKGGLTREPIGTPSAASARRSHGCRLRSKPTPRTPRTLPPPPLPAGQLSTRRPGSKSVWQTTGCPTLTRLRCSGPTAASRPQPRHKARDRQERHDQRDHHEIRGGDDALLPIHLRLGRRKPPRLGLSQRQPGGRKRRGRQRLIGGVQIRSFRRPCLQPSRPASPWPDQTVRPIGDAVEVYASRRSRKRLASGRGERGASAQHPSRSG
jgi:hypothetical protein